MNAEDEKDQPLESAEGEPAAQPQTNFERLGQHLKSDSLAARLVSAYSGANCGEGAQALHDVLAARLDELKSSFDVTEDK